MKNNRSTRCIFDHFYSTYNLNRREIEENISMSMQQQFVYLHQSGMLDTSLLLSLVISTVCWIHHCCCHLLSVRYAGYIIAIVTCYQSGMLGTSLLLSLVISPVCWIHHCCCHLLQMLRCIILSILFKHTSDDHTFPNIYMNRESYL